jgi:hypothetical protein
MYESSACVCMHVRGIGVNELHLEGNLTQSLTKQADRVDLSDLTNS